jgi:hypothetical protein
MRCLALIIGLSLAAAPALAARKEARSTDDTKLVCKTIRDISSRISREKVCLTKAEWAALSREDQKAVHDLAARSRQRN